MCMGRRAADETMLRERSFSENVGEGEGRGDSERLLITEKRDFGTNKYIFFLLELTTLKRGEENGGFPHTYSRTALKCEYRVLFNNTCVVCR